MQLEFGVQSYAEYITISHNVEISSTVPIVSSIIQDFSTMAPTPKFYCNCPGLPNIFMNKSCTCGQDFLWNGTSCIQSSMCPCYYNSRRQLKVLRLLEFKIIIHAGQKWEACLLIKNAKTVFVLGKTSSSVLIKNVQIVKNRFTIT